MNCSIGHYLHNAQASPHIIHPSFLIRRHGSEFQDTNGAEDQLAIFAGNRWRGQSWNPRTPAAHSGWRSGGWWWQKNRGFVGWEVKEREVMICETEITNLMMDTKKNRW
jgi:hypothetical protein